MSYFYVLTFWGSKDLEFWFRTKAVDIVDCIDDFMYPKDDCSELEFSISLEQLDNEDCINLDEALELEKHMYRLTKPKTGTIKPNIRAIKKLARFLDQRLMIQLVVPDNIRHCFRCNMFTQQEICGCGMDTKDCEV